MPKIVPNLWFDTQALEAAEHYVSVFPGSEITAVHHYTEAGPGREGEVVTVDFTLDGQPHTALNGGPQFTLDEAFSLLVHCADQAEADRYWDRLLEGGGEESMCGWLKDRFGVSWQIVPTEVEDLVFDPDPARAARATTAMLGMRKLDVAAIRSAADEEG